MASADALRIEPLQADDHDRLRQFLARRDDSCVFHQPEWHAVIAATYGHKCIYWAALVGRDIVGVLPVVVVKLPFAGSKVIAMAFQFHSGLPLTDDEAVAIRLVQRAVEHARDIRAGFFELRHWAPVPYLESNGFVAIDSQVVTTATPLEGLELRQMRKGHREEARYALRRGVTLHQCDSMRDLATFRSMYLQEGRKLGTPQAGWNFFRHLHEQAWPRCKLVLARAADDRCLGGLLTLDDGRVMFARYGAYSTPEAFKLRVSKALFWHAMVEGSARGCKSFNFGITWAGDEGLIRFKEGWNATSRPVYQYVYPLRARPPSPGDYLGGFSLAKAVWRRLPLPVVEYAGRLVTSWIC
jgi:hypothetical protein